MTVLFYKPAGARANASGRNAVIASGANLAACLTAAQAACPDGETKVDSTWLNATMATTENNATTPIWIEGNVVEPLQRNKGK